MRPKTQALKDKKVDEILDFSEDEKDEQFALEKQDRTETLVGFTGEKDYDYAPKSDSQLHWHNFCTDMYSSDRKFTEV